MTFEEWHEKNAKYMEPADLVQWCGAAWDAATTESIKDWKEAANQWGCDTPDELAERIRQLPEIY